MKKIVLFLFLFFAVTLSFAEDRVIISFMNKYGNSAGSEIVAFRMEKNLSEHTVLVAFRNSNPILNQVAMGNLSFFAMLGPIENQQGHTTVKNTNS